MMLLTLVQQVTVCTYIRWFEICHEMREEEQPNFLCSV